MKKIHWFTINNLPDTLTEGDMFQIQDQEATRQIQKVLRLKIGEQIFLKNTGFGYVSEISVSNNILEVNILEKKKQEERKKLSLIFCIPKKDKFELILEKCSEIGVTDFYPVISDRTIKTNINIERASKIIQEASEQAQRLDTPKLHTVSKLDDVLGELRPIVFDVEGDKVAQSNLSEERVFLIGPEGGFSERELELFREKELKIYKLGDTVLKTETAAIVVSGLLMN